MFLRNKTTVLICYCLLFGACKTTTEENQTVNDEKHESEITSSSIYNLESQWITQDSQTVELKNQLGKVQVLAMVYTSCPSVCPKLVADMIEIDDSTKEKFPDLKFTLVTIDPEADTPGKLKEFADEHQLDFTRWQLLHGTEDDILELAAVLNVKYKKVSATDYSHSIHISVLNQNGEVVFKQEGMNADITATISAIENCYKNSSL